mmetsp:Transcript_3875/g.9874  ORF Transcript_3875/g.9874 Transcript_3875/m.9874 type:complete len:280 (-) Transcript_3875:61-900(-)
MASFLSAALALLAFVTVADAITKELYTTNAVCKQNYCVNPVFPGLLSLGQLETQRWYKRDLNSVASHMDFCGAIVNYDPAIPAPNASFNSPSRFYSDEVLQSTVELDRQAAQLYFMHLQGMGIEAWDHVDPLQASSHPLRPCAREVARMACFTFFPKAFINMDAGQEVSYLRPCSSCCQQYVQTCRVECCDDSVNCVFAKPPPPSTPPSAGKSASAGATVGLTQTISGYTLGTAPSLGCTGTESTAQQKSRAAIGYSAPTALLVATTLVSALRVVCLGD